MRVGPPEGLGPPDGPLPTATSPDHLLSRPTQFQRPGIRAVSVEGTNYGSVDQAERVGPPRG